MFCASAPLLLESDGQEVFLDRVRSTIDAALQPITDIRNGTVHGFEALARNTPALGFPSIAEFFAFAERIGARTEVDHVLYSKAAEKLVAAQKPSDALLFFNLDRRRAAALDETLPALLSSIRTAGLAPSDICIEITEGGEASSIEEPLPTVERLRRLGFRLAIDDFGTGLSGLQALYEWQPDYVKIDRFFISGLERDGRKRLFVSRVVDLAHTLGTKVVAEGVERAEELQACREAGCDLVQGFLVSKPTCDGSELRNVYSIVASLSSKSALQSASSLDNEGVITPLGSIADSTRLSSVVEYFLTHPECSFLPVVDGRSMPVGIIRERDLRSLMQSPFGRDLLKNGSFPLTVRDYVARLPVVDAKICPTQLIEQCAQSIEEGIIVTTDMHYSGFVTSNALLRLAGTIRLRQAQSQNPLTHLPANDAILDFIGRACADNSQEHAFCHLDFNDFKPFNDAYGFHIGDRAIIMFAELLRSEFGSDNAFLGHIGGDDFFAGISGPAEDFEARLIAVRKRFAFAAESLYAPEHRARGYIESKRRDGTLARFPLLSCSVALLHLAAGTHDKTTSEISQELARLKTAAKLSATGLAVEAAGPVAIAINQSVALARAAG
ncbi:GGDEF domain-containing protein [Hyphomicrobium sp.]|uniref:GGDEF domain-containing protein n=1 Tax=Hyphomicrobium sp. TaxID=82 RepID=UPI002E36EA65|nr:EAL domain-containing protein [Hyphomicrobium sp.]HEX2842592.1 EAL domain-containing protein [Hyphomicrobium sp.]